jgi:two-component system sensor histidine kinase RegB
MNPYTIFFLVHIVMASVVLGGGWTWLFVGLCGVCYASLFFIAPVSPHAMHDHAFASHLYGMLSSFVVASACTGYFVLLVQRERKLAEARAAAAQEAALKAESFAALTAVAAGAAHELGTPLSTIAVAARELERSAERVPNAGGLAMDARLIREEVDRCRRILDAMAPPFPGGDDSGRLSSEELIGAILARVNAVSRARITVMSVAGESADVPRNRATQAAAALVQNALDASRERVTLACQIEPEGLAFHVEDDGPGIPPGIEARLGEPFFTTKQQGRGLGLFLVRQFVEQVGGTLRIESQDGRGTRATMVLPLAEKRG